MTKHKKISKKDKNSKNNTTPEERRILAESYLRWLKEYGDDFDKSQIVEIDKEIFLLCAEEEYDYGELDLKYIGYTPEEIEQGMIKYGYYKENKSAKHFIDWFNEKYSENEQNT